MSSPDSDRSTDDDSEAVGRYSIDRSRMSRVRNTDRDRAPVDPEYEEDIEEPEEPIAIARPVERPKSTTRRNNSKSHKSTEHRNGIVGGSSATEEFPDTQPTRPVGAGISLDRNKIISLFAILIIFFSVIGYLIYDPDDHKPKPPEPITVNVPERLIGDKSVYKVTGDLLTKSDNGNDEAMEMSFYFQSSSRTTITIMGFDRSIEDGFGQNHTALETKTRHDLRVQGDAKNVPEYGDVDIESSQVTLTERAYTVSENITIASRVNTDIDLQFSWNGLDKSYESTDEAWLYPNILNLDTQKGLDTIYRHQELAVGDEGGVDVGSVSFPWLIEEQAKIAGVQALRIGIDVSQSDLDRINEENDMFQMNELTMDTWVSNEFPMPVKNEIYVKGVYNNGEYNQEVALDYTITLIDSEFERGTKAIEYRTYTAAERNSMEEREDWFSDIENNIERLPSHGTEANSSIPPTFTAEIAFDLAYLESLEFRDYMNNQTTEAYAILCLYNDSDVDNDPKWNMTFAESGSDDGYHIIVHPNRIEDNGVKKLSDIQFGLGADDPQSALNQTPLTFAGFEQILKNNSVANEELFSNGQLNFDEVTLRLQTNLFYPGIDLTKMFIQFDYSRYAYAVNKGDDFTAAVDAETGQFLFTISHEGDELF